MKIINHYGSLLFDYLVLTILIIVSFITIVPIYVIYVGIIGYFDAEEKELKHVFETIKQNYKIMMKINGLILVLIIPSLFHINYINVSQHAFNTIIYGVSYFFIIISGLIIIYSPIIMIKMRVTMKELIINVVYLTFTNLLTTILLLVFLVLFIYLTSKISILFVLTILVIYKIIHDISRLNLTKCQKKGE